MRYATLSSIVILAYFSFSSRILFSSLSSSTLLFFDSASVFALVASCEITAACANEFSSCTSICLRLLTSSCRLLTLFRVSLYSFSLLSPCARTSSFCFSISSCFSSFASCSAFSDKRDGYSSGMFLCSARLASISA